MSVHLAQTAVSPIEVAETDPFGTVAPKLAALLGLNNRREVAVVGPGAESWAGDLSSYFSRCNYYESPESLIRRQGSPHRNLGLVLWAPEGASVGDTFRAAAENLHHAIAADGALLVLAEEVVHALGAPATHRLFGRASMKGTSAALQAAGFSTVRRYVTFPNAFAARDFVGPTRHDIRLLGGDSVLGRALGILGSRSGAAAGSAYLASGPAGGPDAILAAVTEALSESSAGEVLVLERFVLRARGALILSLRGRNSGAGYICRITTDAGIDEIVRENSRWTGTIHRSRQVPERLRHLVPAPLAKLRIAGNSAYVEQRLDGVIGWKLAHSKRRERRLFRDVYEFSRDLAIASVQQSLLAPDVLDQLLPLPRHAWLDDETSALLATVRRLLVRNTADTLRPLSWNHGDYGYGNVLADSRSGRLVGVIDWDHARADLAGVDLVNFLIQRARTVKRWGLPEAVEDLAERVLMNGFRAVDEGIDIESHLPQDRQRNADLLGWSIWRFVERDMRYREGFFGSRMDLLEVLRISARILDY